MMYKKFLVEPRRDISHLDRCFGVHVSHKIEIKSN